MQASTTLRDNEHSRESVCYRGGQGVMQRAEEAQHDVGAVGSNMLRFAQQDLLPRWVTNSSYMNMELARVRAPTRIHLL